MKKKYTGLFITGTDTGVGKTYIAARIAEELAHRGITVGVMKPAETGCRRRNGRLHPSDAVRLMKSAHCSDSLDLVNPYRFVQPLAPQVAAALSGRQIDPVRIKRSFRRLSDSHEFLIVEGAGGIMVPLSAGYCYRDLAADLGLPVLVVARPGLGTINHTVLTVTALKVRRIPVAGIVMNYSRNERCGQAEMTSPGIIEQMTGISVIGVVAFQCRDLSTIIDRLPGVPSGYRTKTTR